MKAAFQSIALFSVVLMVTGFFFVQMSGSAAGQVAEILGLGKDVVKLGGRFLLPLALVFMFAVFARGRM